MAEEKEVLGYIDCEVCGSPAPVKNSKKGYVYVTCCGQYFARTEKADKAIRAAMRATPQTEVKEDAGIQEKGTESESADGKQRSNWDD